MRIVTFVRKEWKIVLGATLLALIVAASVARAFQAWFPPAYDPMLLGFAPPPSKIGFPLAFLVAYEGGTRSFIASALLADFLILLPVGAALAALYRKKRPVASDPTAASAMAGAPAAVQPMKKYGIWVAAAALAAIACYALLQSAFPSAPAGCGAEPCTIDRAGGDAQAPASATDATPPSAETVSEPAFKPIVSADRAPAPPCTVSKGPATGYEREGWKTYTNTAYCFTFRYPGDWKLEELPAEGSYGVIVRLRAPDARLDPYSDGLIISYWPSMDYEAARGGDWTGSWQYAGLEEYFTDPNAFKSKTGEIRIDGRTAYEVIIGGMGANYGVMIERGGIYELSFPSASDAQGMSPDQERMLSTFRFLD